ncbi:ABC transporter substrate-binding protein [Nocardioides zeae]|uniref:ABC transporter substrate-binding protein n=1 Tax=Nocardioides imazamoxiresistens TaxID=3231893 RepID=A0ABU3PVU6_9ACTN|nr:ABC transporter substrate-binding protein [Nocardioides zeae]MDT9593314.1 ABC transporter substrate-binding protein [Nocardioides zeae]
MISRKAALLSLVAVAPLAFAGCASEDAEADPNAATIEVEDNFGTVEVASPPSRVVATDNRLFETLSDWGVELVAAPVPLIPESSGYFGDDGIVDLGLHTEPDLEAVVAAEPDLIVNGQRFADYQEDFASLAPDAAIVSLDPREGEPLDEELKRQVTVLGEIFDKQDEAQALADELDAAVERAAAAYDAADTVMAVNVSAGEIGYLAPGVGRTLGPVFDLLGLSPALEVDGSSDDHQGDDISVEAIASAEPDWILVLDRDAPLTTQDGSYVPAAEAIEGSQALAGVPAVEEDQIVYMPTDTYLNEGIQTYIEFLDGFADALEGAA